MHLTFLLANVLMKILSFVKAFNLNLFRKSSVIRQKGESQNRCFKNTKHAKFSEKQTFLTPWYAHVLVRIRGNKCSFFGKFGVLCFPETPVLRFAVLPYYQQNLNWCECIGCQMRC